MEAPLISDGEITAIPQYQVTVERRVPSGLDSTLGNAGLPRAVIAASREKPKGTEGKNVNNRTVLQQHVEFWDEDGDGVIRPFDTLRGFRRLGFNIFLSAFAMFIIHLGFAYVTQSNWVPFLGNPFFKIYVDKIHKGKHGSDSETFDSEGRFVPEKFEEIFSKYDREGKGGLSFGDIRRLIYGNANACDPFGWMSAVFEWGILFLLCAQNGIISKEDVRSQYDGSLFYRVAERVKEGKFRKTYFPVFYKNGRENFGDYSKNQ
ncbi:13684_t:CDS:2 [Cetraspora pellucida]|uniref:13684_t:CDS:1 n=1 Tax=Cetraspora pellucida TaxID=1433469 RepID=A0ACA9N047_9GLOM|nr:13684_t:CDS:2 [Cetraspora pellucida]